MNMIEKVARAICKEKSLDPDKIVYISNWTSPAHLPHRQHGQEIIEQQQWECEASVARAAIEAMREPELEMLAAFWRQKNCGAQEIGERGDATSDYDAYRAMIDAALKD